MYKYAPTYTHTYTYTHACVYAHRLAYELVWGERDDGDAKQKQQQHLVLKFRLGVSCYATSLLRELLKQDLGPGNAS